MLLSIRIPHARAQPSAMRVASEGQKFTGARSRMRHASIPPTSRCLQGLTAAGPLGCHEPHGSDFQFTERDVMAVLSTGSTQMAHDTSPEGTNVRAMSIATTLFFMWGFLTCLNDILIPHLKAIFDLNYTMAMLVQFAFFSSYFIFALPAGKIVEMAGYKRTMVIGLLTMTAGALLFLPASMAPSFPLFLCALIVLAAGITILQVAANPYVAHLGPPRTASSRLNLAQAFNSFGTFLAPFFGGAVILSHIPKVANTAVLTGAALQRSRIQEASSVQLPYLGIALALAALA